MLAKSATCVSGCRNWSARVAAAMLFVSTPLRAECEPPEDCVGVGKWNLSVALGVGARSNPLVNGKDIPLVILPQISYYGKRFFLDNLDLGFTLLDHPVHQLNLLATPGYDRVFFVRHDLQNYFTGNVGSSGAASSAPGSSIGVTQSPTPPATANSAATQSPAQSPHGFSYLAGIEWTAHVGDFESQLDVLQEITGRHRGQEVRMALAMPLIQSTHDRELSVTASAGVTWKSAALVNYYYGVSNQYVANAALNPFVKLKLSKPVNQHWSMVSFVHWEHLGSGIANSPWVEQSSVLTGFAGALYAF